ncbi:MAG: VWA domain-containing protein [Hyphomicrobiales bacterium]|nr:VWA domain-containing protein [Hyphomicrobiales bacterium]
MTSPEPQAERRRRWRLVLGGDEDEGELSEQDQRIDRALSALYGRSGSPSNRKSGLGGSAPRVARWLDDIRELFPTPVVQVIQRDALERLNLKALMLQPELLDALEADVHLVADLISLRSAIPVKAKETARAVVRKVVDDLMQQLTPVTAEAVRGAARRGKRTHRPRLSDIDWPRTIQANLRHWQPDLQTLVPERLVGLARQSKTRADLDSVILCVDQSGSMAPSVVYASIFAAVMASLPVIETKLVCFDTAILDLSDELADPVEVLFGVQLGGGTDINAALAYCADLVTQPTKTHLVLISDLYEGGNAEEMQQRAAGLIASGVNVIVLLALSDSGRPGYHGEHAQALAAMGCPVFACTPDRFPDLMAQALERRDIQQWAASRDIALVRPGEGPT